MVFAVCFLPLFALLAFTACSNDSYSGETESVTIGSAPLESSALLYIAEERGFFSQNGVDATIKQFDTGAASLNGLLKGEVDIATPAEYALVGKAFERKPVSAIATIDKVQYFYVVGRKDRGVRDITDLKGKKIGVVRKTTAEFYLGRFLEIGGIRSDEVTLVDIDVTKSGDVIAAGDVDAIVTRPPYVMEIEQQLGENAVIWPAQSSQPLYAVMVAQNEWIQAKPELLKRLFDALLDAEKFVLDNPAESKAIVMRRLDLSEEYIENVWSQNQFLLSLEQPLIVTMEDQARWMMNNGLTGETAVPDFRNYIYEQSLETVKGEAVNMIR
jgi:NitT/TauT family transport system substrate-binding protein